MATITLDQARALDAFAREGTFQRAGKLLHKAHTAVIYAIASLEEQLGVDVLDRSGYRTRLTPAGVRVLDACRRLLDAEREVFSLCAEIKHGWEPSLRIVIDGIVPPGPVVDAVARLATEAPTRIDVVAEFLSGVEETFSRSEADLMISVLPPQSVALRSVPLPPIDAYLVAHATHPLAVTRGWLTRADLEAHLLLSVRGSDPRLELSTSGLEQRSRVHLNDFATKKAAILAGAGYGWLPGYLVDDELRRGTVRKLRWKPGNEHAFRPRLYHRATPALGRAAKRVVEALRAAG